MSLPRYPKYKDSGVEWLGEVPTHWDISRLRWVCQIKKRLAGELGYDILSITQRGIRVKDTESNDGQLSMDYSKYQLVDMAPRRFVWNPTVRIAGHRRARWACGQAAFEPVHMSTGQLPGARN